MKQPSGVQPGMIRRRCTRKHGPAVSSSLAAAPSAPADFDLPLYVQTILCTMSMHSLKPAVSCSLQT